MKIIYDIGSNNGDDLPYYLQKADLVVAVEANPVLVDVIKSRFSDAITEGKLVVESCVVTAGKSSSSVSFYIERQHHVLSQFKRPPESDIASFDEVKLPSRSLLDIIVQYGSPHYIKIDIEGYDHVLLKNLFVNKIFPPYVSAESHSIEVFAVLITYGGYDAFKLVDGSSVPEVYVNHPIRTATGLVPYSFPGHSAGPFGNDINGDWQTAQVFFQTLAAAGLGWKDIHASNIDQI